MIILPRQARDKHREKSTQKKDAFLQGFNASGKPAVGREVRWNGGYVRQALTKYDFFNESVLDQGS
eukprot:COSAG06_NODE_26327_length_617_cov_0.826255_2_plen_65_part_01